MPTPEEKKRRAELKRQVRATERSQLEKSLPLPPKELRDLFEHLDQSLAEGCDSTLRFTRAFVREKALPQKPVLEWLIEHGGGCDCEVLANVEEKVEPLF